MPSPQSGQLSDDFLIRLVRDGTETTPPTRPGILVDSPSKEKEYAWHDPNEYQTTWYVGFCYIIGVKGASAFTLAINKGSGPGPATLAGTISPTEPATQVEYPQDSDTFVDARRYPKWVHFGNIQGNIPSEPTNFDTLTDEQAVAIYNGVIGIVEKTT